MITREEIRELAQFHTTGNEGWALSFYFEPPAPQNKSHREEAILAKDLVRKALREAEKNSRNGSTRADLNRILEMAENLHGNQAHARAVFACGSRNFWREFDLPSQLPGTQTLCKPPIPFEAAGGASGRTASAVGRAGRSPQGPFLRSPPG